MQRLVGSICLFLSHKNTHQLNEYSSKLLEQAVNELSRLPSIGKRTALRLALHLLKEDQSQTQHLAEALLKMRKEIRFCTRCNNISDTEVCEICNNHRRDESTLCIVEDTRDVLAIEQTAQYNGLYHVLGGIINPIEGIGPNDIDLAHVVQRLKAEDIHEVILALPATVEGDTTSYYIYKLLTPFDLKITTLARGLAVGNELEYTDEITLGRSLLNRTLFAESNKNTKH